MQLALGGMEGLSLISMAQCCALAFHQSPHECKAILPGFLQVCQHCLRKEGGNCLSGPLGAAIEVYGGDRTLQDNIVQTLHDLWASLQLGALSCAAAANEVNLIFVESPLWIPQTVACSIKAFEQEGFFVLLFVTMLVP